MTRSATILIVEDEPAIRLAVSATLVAAGFSVLEVSDLRSAREVVGSADVVVLDYELPDGIGFDLLREIKSDPHNVPVIVMSAYGGPEHSRAAMTLGAFFYARKPFALNRLRALIEDALKTSSDQGASCQAAATDRGMQVAQL
jgi:two-component system response regulator PilR (NtrC family)